MENTLAKTASAFDPTAKTNLFDYIGFYAPDAMLLLTGILLLNRVKFLAVYILFYFVNHWVNRILKDTIRQPRPSGSRPLIGEKYPKTSFGMPSYHSQKIWFAITFLYLVKANIYLWIGGLFIAFLTMYQRWKYRAHSITQLAVGAVLGASIANLGYYLANLYLTSLHLKSAY
jgi:membrane-associated phospholipid phosphatase